LTVSLGVTSARAQTDAEQAARRVLLEQAQAASTAGDHARALDLAARAGRLQMTPSLRMFISQEQQAAGQFANALGTADLCVREAEHDPTLHNRDAIMSRCNDLRTSLRGRVGLVAVHVPSPAPAGIRVTVGGQLLNEALYGVASVANPGAVVIEATAPGRLPFRQSVDVVVGQTSEVHVDLVEAPEAPTASASPPPTEVSSSAPTGTGTQTGHAGATESPTPRWQRGITIPVIAAAGIGVIGFGTSLVFFILRGSAIGDCHVAMDAMGQYLSCPSVQSMQRAQNAGLFDTMSAVSLGVGIAGVGAAAVLFVLATRDTGSHANQAHTFLDAYPIPGGAAVGLRGRF
jgi:hypothetical protein